MSNSCTDNFQTPPYTSGLGKNTRQKYPDYFAFMKIIGKTTSF